MSTLLPPHQCNQIRDLQIKKSANATMPQIWMKEKWVAKITFWHQMLKVYYKSRQTLNRMHSGILILNINNIKTCTNTCTLSKIKKHKITLSLSRNPILVFLSLPLQILGWYHHSV